MPISARLSRPFAVPLAVAASLIGVTAQAQDARSGDDLGLRYLSWSGKSSNTPASVVSAAGAAADGLRRPQSAPPRPQAVSAPAPTLQPAGRANRYSSAASSIGLTPASAWIGRPATAPVTPAQAPAPTPALAPAPAPPPLPVPNPEPVPASGALDLQPSASLRRQDAYYAAPPVAQQAMQPTPQPSQHLASPPEIPTAAPHDPMAPRRDALIFRMGRPATALQTNPDAEPAPAPVDAQAQAQAQAQTQAPAPSLAATPTTAQAVRPGQPPRQGARYYSVHRQAGLQPDPMVLPDSVFIGGTTDLAEPPPVATPTRLVNGRAQIMVPNADPSLP